MEEFPNINPENINHEGSTDEQPPKSFTEHMAEIQSREKSFAEAQRDGEVPEGVRDEQDYQEFLAERNARQSEFVAKAKERFDEKSEILGSFEKRIAANSDLYNELAEETAFLWSLFPDVAYVAYGAKLVLGGYQNKIMRDYEDESFSGGHNKFQLNVPYGPEGATKEEYERYRTELTLAYAFKNAREMMRLLRKGTENESPSMDDVLDEEDLVIPYEDRFEAFHDKLDKYIKENPEKDADRIRSLIDSSGRDISKKDYEEFKKLRPKTKNLIIPKDNQELFGKHLSGYFISKMDYGYALALNNMFTSEQINKAHEKAHEMMDSTEWHSKLDGILKEGSSLGRGYLYSSYDADRARDTLVELDRASNEDIEGIDYFNGGNSKSPKFIPKLEDTYQLLDKINQANDIVRNTYRYLYEDYPVSEVGNKIKRLTEKLQQP